MGQATAKLAMKHVQLEFVGSGSPKEVAAQFKNKLALETACFPISDLSLKSIQKALSPGQVENIESYITAKADVKISDQDLYLFTSPSNVQSFLNANSIPDHADVIAIGPSTHQELFEANINAFQAIDGTILSMIDLANKL